MHDRRLLGRNRRRHAASGAGLRHRPVDRRSVGLGAGRPSTAARRGGASHGVRPVRVVGLRAAAPRRRRVHRRLRRALSRAVRLPQLDGGVSRLLRRIPGRTVPLARADHRRRREPHVSAGVHRRKRGRAARGAPPLDPARDGSVRRERHRARAVGARALGRGAHASRCILDDGDGGIGDADGGPGRGFTAGAARIGHGPLLARRFRRRHARPGDLRRGSGRGWRRSEHGRVGCGVRGDRLRLPRCASGRAVAGWYARRGAP